MRPRCPQATIERDSRWGNWRNWCCRRYRRTWPNPQRSRRPFPDYPQSHHFRPDRRCRPECCRLSRSWRQRYPARHPTPAERRWRSENCANRCYRLCRRFRIRPLPLPWPGRPRCPPNKYRISCAPEALNFARKASSPTASLIVGRLRYSRTDLRRCHSRCRIRCLLDTC